VISKPLYSQLKSSCVQDNEVECIILDLHMQVVEGRTGVHHYQNLGGVFDLKLPTAVITLLRPIEAG